jgi:Short C-terminal domain
MEAAQNRAAIQPALAAMSDLDRIQKLADLRAGGAITDQEYATEKAKVLSPS